MVRSMSTERHSQPSDALGESSCQLLAPFGISHTTAERLKKQVDDTYPIALAGEMLICEQKRTGIPTPMRIAMHIELFESNCRLGGAS